jgi:hypothetical protein
MSISDTKEIDVFFYRSTVMMNPFHNIKRIYYCSCTKRIVYLFDVEAIQIFVI